MDVSLVISFIALLISGYGIVERREGARREVRARFAGIVGELSAMNLQEAERTAERAARVGPEGRGDAGWEVASAEFAARRAVLAEQALVLERQLRGWSVTAEEYATLGRAYEYVRDLDEALDLYRRATALPSVSAMTRAACWRSTAGCCYLLGRLDDLRDAIERALAATPDDHDGGRADHAQTCLDWARGELDLAPPDDSRLDKALARGRASAQSIRDPRERARVVALVDEQEGWMRAEAAGRASAGATAAASPARTADARTRPAGPGGTAGGPVSPPRAVREAARRGRRPVRRRRG